MTMPTKSASPLADLLAQMSDSPQAIMKAYREAHNGHGPASDLALLERYEQDKGVTFAALDNDALESVREAVEALYSPAGYLLAPSADRVRMLCSALNDLLGLESLHDGAPE